MKKLTLSLVAILLMAGLFQRCITSDEPVSQDTGKVQFSFLLDSQDEGKSRLPDHATLIVSIEKPDGELLLTTQPVKFGFSEGRYLTEALELEARQFKVVDFMIVDGNQNILYAAPQAGSQLDRLGNHSLSNTWVTERNNPSTYEMKLLSVANHTPESFGLKSFKAIKRHSFQIVVYVMEDGKKKFTDATGYVTQGNDTLHVYELKPHVNHVIFKGDAITTYTLTIRKNGYETHTRQFTLADLKKNQLRIILEPANAPAKLKAFVLNSRRYEFYYNNTGTIDSIVASEGSINYRYVIEYTNGQINKVSTIDNGVLVSTHESFEYDAGGQLIYYEYVYPEAPEYPVPYNITYDEQGNIESINGETYQYDDQHNMIAGFGATYTYDTGLNPLHTENLFAMFVEEPFIWSMLFSQHNQTSITSGSSTSNVVNHYDADGNLILRQQYNNGTLVSEVPFYYY